MTTLPQNPDVIVIGAGAAGLSAAKALQNAGFEVVVLESAAHTGGRCVTDTSTFATPFDRGGSWLHSAPINPLAREAERLGVPLFKDPAICRRAQYKGYDLTAQEVADYVAYGEVMWPAIDARGGQAPDITTGDAMPAGAWADLARCWIPHMVGGDADESSAADSHNYGDADGDWLVAGGLGAFVQRLHADVPVQLNCPVRQIDTSGQGVRVSTPQGVLQADHVILTVSTNVLAAGAITFVPPLPVAKQEAIDALPCGLLNKVGIEFDPAWKGPNENDMGDYQADDEAFCSVQFGFYGSPLAVAFVGGRFAEKLERAGPGTATDFCLEGLRALYGSDVLKHVRLTAETAWRTNPHTLGAYSFARVGAAPLRPVLAETLYDRLFFAGEATMIDTYSTVHGAVLSGQRAARAVQNI